MPTPRITLVTCLFDLARREPETGRRTLEAYLDLAENFVLGLEHDLVVFADPEAAWRIEAERRRGGLAERTQVVPVALEDLPHHALLGEMIAAREAHPLANGNPAKDTPLYTVLTCSKPGLIARVAREDPFSASHLAWVDIGLPFRPHPGEDPFAQPSERVRLLQMRPFFARELADRERYLGALWGHVAGGYICGSRESMLRLAESFESLAREALAAGLAGSDEQLLPLVIAANPGAFEFHHGDYDHLLANYLRPHGSAENLAFQLRVWRAENATGEGAPVARAVVESIEAGEFEARPKALAELLDECYLAAFYGEPEPHALARRIADLYTQRAERDSAFCEAFLRDEARITKNFAFLEG